MPAKNVEERTIVLIFIPLICLVKCFCPRNRAAKEMQPVLRPMRHALTRGKVENVASSSVHNTYIHITHIR